MEYISAEEFLKQSKEVQKVFVDWWKPQENDLFIDLADTTVVECINYIKNGIIYTHRDNMSDLKYNIIPLLTEGQLRKFIEDKTECKVVINFGEVGYQLVLIQEDYNWYKDFGPWEENCFDLFQAYWKVAVQIAEQEEKENASRK